LDITAEKRFVSRAGEKLQFAFDTFIFSPFSLVCADFGCSTGGFTDCMLKNGARKVYSVDTAYGELDYKLRNDERVMVYERNNAMHVRLPKKMQLITVDVAWTKQEKVLPNVLFNLKENGWIITLVKPSYESERDEMVKGNVKPEAIPAILSRVEKVFELNNLEVLNKAKSPITGRRAGNEEWIYLLTPKREFMMTSRSKFG
jgi:23S rRNA (cytidine1920-2'-O)/16S rRNA (cytidine1409-2'-O)-methyltransferase